MHRQSETRAGNHQRHTRTRNASLPTQANHTVRGARKQPPNQGAIHAALPLFRLLVTQRCQSRYNRQGHKAKDRCQSNASKATEQNTDHVERYQGRQCAIVQDTYTYLGPIIAPPAAGAYLWPPQLQNADPYTSEHFILLKKCCTPLEKLVWIRTLYMSVTRASSK